MNFGDFSFYPGTNVGAVSPRPLSGKKPSLCLSKPRDS
jgi:hypothetical protein